MKILFVMPSHISYGGIETVGINLWKGLKRLGHQVEFVSHGDKVGVYEEYIKSCGSIVYHIPVKSKNLFKTIYQFEKILKRGSYDVVHAHMNATSGIYLEIARKQQVPVLVAHSHASTMASFTTNIFKAFINQMEKRRTNKYANIRIACSEKAGNWLFGRNSYSIILNAVDNEKYKFSDEIRKVKRKELNLLDNNYTYIHIGAFLKCKNHKFLIEIFKKIEEDNKDAKLILVGDGPLKRKVIKKIRKFNLEKSVLVLGERNDISELLQAADMFLLPSISEGNPVSLVEAATSGLNCLVSNNVPKDIEAYFAQGSIQFLPISGRNSMELWVKNSSYNYERIIYSKKNPLKLSSLSMAHEVEKLYLQVMEKFDN